MNVSVVIPKSSVPHGTLNIKEWVMSAALDALKLGLDPVPFPKGSDGNTYNLKMYLNQARMAAMSGRPEDMPMSAYISGLVHAWVMHQRRLKKEEEEQCFVPLPEGLRDEQKRLIAQVEAKMGDKKIVFAEAGTGIGKTRAALIMAMRKKGRSVIAVPTLAVLAHVLSEYVALQGGESAGEGPDKTLGFVIGRGNFVSPSRLQDVLENPEGIPEEAVEQAKAWLESQGAAAEGAKTAALHAMYPLSWLSEDLQHVAPGFPVNSVILGEEEDESCPAQAIYQSLRQAIQKGENQIIVCTHAMLAMDAILKKRELVGILPHYENLFIDEAHLLESSFASLHSHVVNPRMLIHRLDKAMPNLIKEKKKGAAQNLQKGLKKLHEQATVLAEMMPDERIRLNGVNPSEKEINARHLIQKSLEDIGKIPLSEIAKSSSDLRSSISSLQHTIRSMKQNNGEGVWLSFSPRRRFPSLTSGPRSVRGLLQFLWENTRTAVLMSATLFIPDTQGIPRVGYVARILAVPSERMETVPPITQSWLYEPKLFLIGKPEYLLQDSSPDEHDKPNPIMQAWGKNIAQALLPRIRTAHGGSLVLTTSYARAQAIAQGLLESDKDHGDWIDQRMVLQNRNHGIRHALVQFMRKQSIRPILIGTGSAWTGIDLRADDSIPPEEDRVLTDLFIANLPFGTNRSTTHATRVEQSFLNERDRALLEFKQGLGRLMRRKGVLNRRIWILDPRIDYLGSVFVPFRKMIEPYKVTKS